MATWTLDSSYAGRHGNRQSRRVRSTPSAVFRDLKQSAELLGGFPREHPQKRDLALRLAHRDDLVEYERQSGAAE